MSESVSAMNERHAQEFNEHGRPVGHQYAEMRDLAIVIERQNAELIVILEELCVAGKITSSFGQKEAERLGRAWTAARAALARALG